MNTKLTLVSLALALAAYEANASQYWTNNVAPHIGWVDYNKNIVFDNDNNFDYQAGESNLCWAASASNMLTWWQQHNTQKVPANTPNGSTIWSEFKQAFTDEGLDQESAIKWWFTGDFSVDEEETPIAQLTEYGKQEAGNYYDYTEEQVANYLTTHNICAHSQYLTPRLISDLKAGKCIGAGISSVDGALSHAVTIWGVDYNETTGRITRVWMTDSDDSEAIPCVNPETGEHSWDIKPNGLVPYDVEEQTIITADGHKIKALVLKNYYAGALVYLEDFSSLSLNPHEPVDSSEASLMKTRNGYRSMKMLVERDDNEDTPSAQVENLLNIMGDFIGTYDVDAIEKISTALGGTSIPALGKAFSDDVNRRLQTIRNHATQNTDNNKKFHVWVEAEGSSSSLDASANNTEAGYDLDSWGASIGFSASLTNNLQAGLAFSSLSGDFSAQSNDHATGDLETYYLSAFTKLNVGKWEHSFVATAGRTDTELTRSTHYSNFFSRNSGTSDGTGFGLMYETAYNFQASEKTTISPVINLSATHSNINSYTEQGDVFALSAGDSEMDTLTIGVGARMQTEFGEKLLNHSALLQCRAMLNFHTGDRYATTDIRYAKQNYHTSLRSAESGEVGLELGVGALMPLNDGHSAIFANIAAEINSGYTEANASVGYRFSF